MTYAELKEAYPLGCSVKTNWIDVYGGPVGKKKANVEGKILAILDPEGTGPKCLLFEIECPEDRRISNEGARATILRKGTPFDSDVKTYHRRAKAICAGVEEAKNGSIKWLRPSDIK